MIPPLSIYIEAFEGNTVEARDFRCTPFDENNAEQTRCLDEHSCDALVAASTIEHLRAAICTERQVMSQSAAVDEVPAERGISLDAFWISQAGRFRDDPRFAGMKAVSRVGL